MSSDQIKFKYDPTEFIQGYYRSASLAGAYSGYNIFYMHFAGIMGGIESQWIVE